MKRARAFLAVLVFLVSMRDARSQCVNGDLRVDRAGQSTIVIGSAVSIFPDLPFTCDGRITSWRAVGRELNTPNTAQTEFQVWRPTASSPQTFTLIASVPAVIESRVPGSPTNPHVFLAADLTAAVYVQRGDVPGVFTPAGVQHSLAVDLIGSGGSVQWISEVSLSRGFCTFETCSPRVKTTSNVAPKFEINIDETNSGTSPPVTACQQWLFDPCNSTTTVLTMTTPTRTVTTPTRTVTTPTHTVAMPTSTIVTPTPSAVQDAIIAAGVICSVLAIVGVVGVIIVMSFLLWKRQKGKGMYETRRQDVNCYNTTDVTTPVSVDGQPPVANEPQYAPIGSTIRERTVSQHYEFENDPVINPMYRPSFHNKLHKRPYPRQFPPVPKQTENKPHEYAVLERSPTQTAPPVPMPYAIPLIHGGVTSSSVPSREASSEQDAGYATLENTHSSSRDSYWEPSESEVEIYAHLARGRYLQVSSDTVKMGRFLGKGQFALVHKAVWVSQCGEIEVAVKELRRGASSKDRVRFLQEAAIMGQFNHTGIIKLYGVVKEKKPMIILEYLPKGNLREYLNSLALSSFQDVPRQLLKFGRQIASGMNYLANMGFIHRDLAARNILLTQDCNCKIADFGMSRDLAHQDYYITSGGRIPLKWTAPEALTHRRYSTKSDVWSFGVVLFEIWSIGKKPYSGTSNAGILKLLLEGQRLSPPPGCPRGIYKLIIQCWNPEPSKRPPFSSISDYLSQEDLSLLHIHADDQGLPPAAYMLGAPIEEGHLLYKDLQRLYLSRPSTSDHPACNDYEVPTSTRNK